MTLNDENKKPEQKPEENITQDHNDNDKSDNISKPIKLDLKPNIVICNMSHLDKKNPQKDEDTHNIKLENNEKKEH